MTFETPDVSAHRAEEGRRSRFLTDAAVVLSSSLDRQTIVDDFLRLAVERFSDGCVVDLAEEDGTLLRAGVAHRDADIERQAREILAHTPVGPRSPSTLVAKTKQPMLVQNTRDPTAQSIADLSLLGAWPVESLLVAPMIVADKVVGTIGFISSNPLRHFDASDVEIATAVARLASLAFQNVGSFERERKSADRFRYLTKATDALFARQRTAGNIQEVLDATVGESADWAAVILIEPSGDVRVSAIAHHRRDADLVDDLRGLHIFDGEGRRRFLELCERRRVRVVDSPDADPWLSRVRPYLQPVLERIKPESMVAVPLYADESTFGALLVCSTVAGRTYDQVDAELFGEIGRRLSLALEHAQSAERERRLAQTLQEATLPAQLPVIPGAILTTTYEPASTSDAQVGGDWYDAFALQDGRIVFSVGDVEGRGLHAAVVMGKLRHSLNVIGMYERNPARILDAAETIVLQRYPDTVATAFVAIYDPRTKSLEYANAGHPHPILRLAGGEIEYLKSDGLPIGLRGLAPPSASRARNLSDVALMVLYTDGITEVTRDIARDEAKLVEVVSSEAALYVRNPAELITAACGRGVARDDVALLTLSFPHSINWTFDADNAKAAQDARGAFLERLTEEATPESDLSSAELIFGELVGNVVRHAPGPIDIALETSDHQAILHVIDRGGGFVKPASRTAVDVLCEEGRGLWLIEEFGRGLAVEGLAGYGTHVRVMLPVTMSRRPHAEATRPRRKRFLQSVSQGGAR